MDNVVPFEEESPKKKLLMRGPYKIELDFAIDALCSDGSIDTSDPVGEEIYRDLQRKCLGLKLMEYHGPAGGHPVVEIHGTESALVDYVKNIYLKGSGFNDSDVQDFLRSIERT